MGAWLSAAWSAIKTAVGLGQAEVQQERDGDLKKVEAIDDRVQERARVEMGTTDNPVEGLAPLVAAPPASVSLERARVVTLPLTTRAREAAAAASMPASSTAPAAAAPAAASPAPTAPAALADPAAPNVVLPPDVTKPDNAPACLRLVGEG